MSKKIIFTILFAVLACTCCMAQKNKSAIKATLKGYPSGAIDEYHFRAGKAVVKGRFANMSNRDFSTFSLKGYNNFTTQDFVRTININPDGSFLEQISLPHSGYVFFDIDAILPESFIAVGDTLEILYDGIKGETTISGSGATDEVNRIWPRLQKQFSSNESETPWKQLDRQFLLDWKNRKVKELDQIARAIDADTISALKGCSNYAKDVLKTNLLAMRLNEISEAMDKWRRGCIRNEDGTINRDLMISLSIPLSTYFDFLSARQSYLLDNPLMVLAERGGWVISYMRSHAFFDYFALSNYMNRGVKGSDSKQLANYKEYFVLPHDYDSELHRQMLEYDKGHLLSVADYYAICSDSIRLRYKLNKTGFMMQLSLLHEVLYFNEDEDEFTDGFLNREAEQLAGAFTQFTDPIICHHAVDAYRRFVIKTEGVVAATPSIATPGDSIFQSLKDKYAGNVIYMDFWGMFCAPCRRGMLDQRPLVEQYKNAPVRFLYICNEQESQREPSEEWLTKNNIQGEHIYLSSDDWNHLAAKFQFNAVPFSLLIDKNGNVVQKRGAPSSYQIDELLK